MKTKIPSYLRIIPKPLAKCGPPDRPYPAAADGIEVERCGRRWLLTHTRNGRRVEFFVTTDELEDLVAQSATLLRRNQDDV